MVANLHKELGMKPITYLRNYSRPNADEQLAELRSIDLPRLVNPAKKYGPLIEEAYWETFAQRPEFYSLVNAHKLPHHLFDLFKNLDEICARHVMALEQSLNVQFKLVLPMMIEITHAPAANHIDTPVRDYTMNWYPFENHGHEVYFGDETIAPQRGDLYLFDVDQFHGTRHPNPGLVTFMSLSLRVK